MLKGVYGGAVDTVGGEHARQPRQELAGGWERVAACGLVGGADLSLTVYPFILRGVNLLGIDSQNCPMPKRRAVWERLAGEWRLEGLERITTEIGLDELRRFYRTHVAGRDARTGARPGRRVRWFLLVLLFTACGAPVPASLGVSGGRLAPCPDSPNCVSTHAPSRRPALHAAHHRPRRRRHVGCDRPGCRRSRCRPAQPRREPETAPTSTPNFAAGCFGLSTMSSFIWTKGARLLHFRSASRLGQG